MICTLKRALLECISLPSESVFVITQGNAFPAARHERAAQIHTAIAAVAANAMNAAAISFFVSFDFLTSSTAVENTITPPVNIGYCTEAGSL